MGLATAWVCGFQNGCSLESFPYVTWIALAAERLHKGRARRDEPSGGGTTIFRRRIAASPRSSQGRADRTSRGSPDGGTRCHASAESRLSVWVCAIFVRN